jgi:Predicted membrane protein
MLKTITFTLMHFCIAFAVAYALTGSVAVGGLLAVVEPLCNSVGFFLHEKLWQRIERQPPAAPQYARRGWQHRHA